MKRCDWMVAVLLAICTTGRTAEFYVAPGGSDDGPGSKSPGAMATLAWPCRHLRGTAFCQTMGRS